jgi:hypothetical protein
MSEMLNLKLDFDSDKLRPSEIEKSVLSFEKEIAGLSGVEKAFEQQINKDIDPLTFAALSIYLAPVVMPKFLEFLTTWAMRRENRLIKIKVQLGKNKYAEFEGSETLSKKDVESWISAVEKALKHK